MPPIERAVHKLIVAVTGQPSLTIVVTLLICAVFLSGLSNFGINPSPRDYLGKDMPLIVDLIELEEEYIEDKNLFIVLKPKTGTVFDEKVLLAIEQVTEAAWRLPHARRVDSLTNFQYTTVEADDLIVDYLVPSVASLSDQDIADVREIALNEPRLAGLLVARDGRAAGINILFTVDMGAPEEMRAVRDGITTIRDAINRDFPDLEVYETGFVALVDHWRRAAILDITRVFSLSLLIILAGLYFFFANFRATLAVVGTSALAVLVALGLIGLAGLNLNPATILATLMVLILGLADGIHVTKSARRILVAEHDYRTAIVEATSSNFTPIALTSITTSIGFLTFNFTGYAGVRLMGNYVAIGVMVAFLLSITLLPALLCFCRVKPERGDADRKPHRLLSNFVLGHRKVLLFLTVPVVLISIACISLNEIDERITRYLKDSYVFTQHLDEIQRVLTGATSMIYNFNTGQEGGVSDPEFMGKVEAFAQWADEQPGVTHVASYTRTMKRLNQNLNGGAPDYYRLPDNRDLAAQYLLLYEMSLPFGLDLANDINLDKSGTRVVLTTNDMSLQQALELVQDADDWLASNAPEFDSFANSSSLSGLLMAEESIIITVLSGVTSLAIIGLLLLGAFRSIHIGFLCVVSVLSPILVTFGIWGLVVGEIMLPAGLSICMVIGITVDFSVHFVSKFVYALRRLDYSIEDSVRYSFEVVSAPIITSTIVLVAGFGVLMFSVFQYNYVIGAITAMCILFAALSAFLLVPSILFTERFSRGIRDATIRLPRQHGDQSVLPSA